MANETTGRESDKFMLRMPDGMRDRLKTEAEANKRSMNAEIVARLESTFVRRIGEPGFSARDFSTDELRLQMLDLSIRMNNIAELFDQAAAKAREQEAVAPKESEAR